MADIVVTVLGVPLGIEAAPEDRERLRCQWSRALASGPADRTIAHEPAQDPADGDYRLTIALTRAALEETSGQRINLHAGGVADDRGRLLVVVGPSGAGKTTAIRSLAQRLGYLSDETVSLSLGGPPYVALPHPKPLSVITDPQRPGRKEQLGPDQIGLRPTPASATLHRVVLLRRGQRSDRPRLTGVPLVEAVVEIVPQSSSLADLDHPLLDLVELLRSVGGPVALEYDEVTDHVEDLIRLLDADLTCTEPAPEHRPGGDGGEAGPGEFARTPWLDAVRVGEDVMVMRGGAVFALDGLGASLWWALDRPLPRSGLVRAAEAALGTHPGSERLVTGALESLSGSGLLRLGSLA